MHNKRNKSLRGLKKLSRAYTYKNTGEEVLYSFMSTMDLNNNFRFPIKYRTNLDPNLKITNITDLIKLPFVVQVRGEFNEETSENFANSFYLAENNGQNIIPIVIDSYGGEIYSLLSMIDIIQASSVPVATIAIGKAMSAGAILLSCGTEGFRFASPHSTIMIHPVWDIGVSGNVDEVKVGAEELVRLNNKILEIMSVNCGHQKDYFHRIMNEKKNVDWYISPREAKKHNIINEIRIPEFYIEVSTRIELI